jgi:hypothetical protein
MAVVDQTIIMRAVHPPKVTKIVIIIAKGTTVAGVLVMMIANEQSTIVETTPVMTRIRRIDMTVEDDDMVIIIETRTLLQDAIEMIKATTTPAGTGNETIIIEHEIITIRPDDDDTEVEVEAKPKKIIRVEFLWAFLFLIHVCVE